MIKLGYIDLEHILKTKPSKEVDVEKNWAKLNKTSDKGFMFTLKVTKWYKMEAGVPKPQPAAKILLVQPCEGLKYHRETEAWMAAIEYLRTKGSFDAFVNNYGKISFEAH